MKTKKSKRLKELVCPFCKSKIYLIDGITEKHKKGKVDCLGSDVIEDIVRRKKK